MDSIDIVSFTGPVSVGVLVKATLWQGYSFERNGMEKTSVG